MPWLRQDGHRPRPRGAGLQRRSRPWRPGSLHRPGPRPRRFPSPIPPRRPFIHYFDSLGADTAHIYLADLLEPDAQAQDDYHREISDSDRPTPHPALLSLWQSPPPPVPGPLPPAREPTFQEVLDRLASLAQLSDAGLIIVDQMEHLAASFGVAHNRVLAKLNLLAHRTGAAVVTLCNIPTDSLRAARNAAMAYSPIPRAIIATARLDHDHHVFLPLSSASVPPIAYRLTEQSIEWGAPLSPSSLPVFSPPNRRASQTGAALRLLDSMLAEGPRPAADIRYTADSLGVSKHYLFQARRLRNVRSFRATGPGKTRWCWTLPGPRSRPSEDSPTPPDAAPSNICDS